MIYIGGEEIQNIYVGDSEISAIYAGEELIYPVNLGTLTGITIEDLTWVEDVPYSGGTASKDNCTYKVIAYYDSGKSRTVTGKATVTGSIEASATTATTRTDLGLLQLTATFEGFTASGSVEAYQEANHYDQYFTFIITGTGKVVWLAEASATDFKTIQYSLDNGVTWTSLTAAKNSETNFDVVAGDVVMFKGNNTSLGSSSAGASCCFSGTTAQFIPEGNTMSLLYGDDFADKKTLPGTYTFRDFLNGVSGFTDASNLILPATACTEQCYRNFFAGTNVINAPKLPALTLARACYNNMFINAYNLEVAPDLLAPVLVQECYSGMLHMQGTIAEENRKLRYIRCLATNISATNCTAYMTNATNVAANGVFVKAASNNSWTRGANGIPNGWTIVNEEV